MKAVRIREPGPPDVLEAVEVPDPRPGPGQVLVRVRAAGVNRADLLQRRGLYPPPPDATPDVPGLEFAGEIAEPGDGEGGWDEGDRVMGLLGGGGYATLAAVHASHLLRIPPSLSFVEAGAVPEVFLTAADALFVRGSLARGEGVLVHSAGGGVGTAALQLARLAGAAPVMGSASAPKLAAIREAGLPLDAGLDRSAPFASLVREHTGGRGVDVILDTVGASYWEENLGSLAQLGRLVVVGLMGGSDVALDLRRLMRLRATVVGTVLRARSVEEKAALTDDFARSYLPGFETGALKPVVDRTWPLEAAAEAHRYMEENRNFGKIVLEVG